MEILPPISHSLLQWDKTCEDESVDNFDLSMGMSGAGQENGDGYMAVDQTFHTPSFGDEEFDIPPINLPPTSGSETVSSDMYGSQPLNHQQSQGQHVSQQQQQQQQPPCSQSMSMGMGDPGVMTSVASTPSPSMSVMDSGPHQYTGPPLHAPPHHDMYMVQIGAGSMLPPQSVHFQVQQYNVPTSYANAPMQQHMEHQVPPHHMGVLPPHHHAHHPQQQHQQLLPPSSMLGLQLGPPRQQRPGSVGSSPPGSNQTSPGLETSEDSDDSGHLSQLMGGIKRPSPEPADRPPSGGKPKKPKVQKKKKKRDPNEPQKPVSAYALFFRDTQAAIKGQNPNASFGEVSKIVASMWDGLDIEHKNVYKKKTEAAKKEYLKALAAYRASLVSKAANDQSESLYGSNPGVSTTTSMSTTSSVPSHSLSPLQKKSPLLTSLMEGTNVNSLQTMTQPQPLLVGQPQMGGGNGLVHHPHMVPQHVSHSGSHMLHHLPPGQMVHAMAIRQPVSQMMGMPNHNHQGQPGGQQVINNNHSYSPNMMSSSPQMSHPGQGVTQSMMGPSQLQNCLRNPGTEPQEWDREYCNNDCVVSHCRDVFTTWVSSRPPPNSYASVK